MQSQAETSNILGIFHYKLKKTTKYVVCISTTAFTHAVTRKSQQPSISSLYHLISEQFETLYAGGNKKNGQRDFD
jgi:hypothetical protein